jgi:two-component system sensor histidine kinase UhpB
MTSVALTKPNSGIRLAALRVPLVTKLVGANGLVVALLAGTWIVLGRSLGARTFIAIGLVVVFLHLALVLLALRPIRELDVVASRVWRGDFRARVQRSRLADEQALRVGSMFNILLDELAADRERLRALTADVIAAGDRERSVLARELHDSTAQRLVALLIQISTAARSTHDPALAGHLLLARGAAEVILEEVRAISYTMHPGLLEDLGLEAALLRLARESSDGNGIDISVNADDLTERLPVQIESAFYRIAQEAMRNAIRHAAPKHIRMNIYRDASTATLEVSDDGCGFTYVEGDRARRGIGLLSMCERAALIDGLVDVRTANGNGTTILATVPLVAIANDVHWEHHDR